MKKSIVLTVALVALMVPSMLLAQSKCTSEMTCKMAPQFSDEQLAKLEELKVEQQLVSIKLGAELKILNIKMERELKKDDPSSRELESLVSKIGAVREKMQKSHIDHLLQVRKILKPEQWKHISKCCGGMGGCCSMRMGCGGSCGGMSGCSSMGMGHAGSCCGGHGDHSTMVGSHVGSGLQCMDKHIFIGKGRSCPCCGGKTGGIHWKAESCCPEGMKGMKVIKKMKEGAPEGGAGKEIKHRCIKIESEK